MTSHEVWESPNRLFFPPWSWRNKLNLSLFVWSCGCFCMNWRSHLESWKQGMQDHQGSGMHALCLITSSATHVKVADVTRLWSFGLCWDTVCVLYGITMHRHFCRGENISEHQVGQGWRIVLLVFMGSRECYWKLVLWDEWQSISSSVFLIQALQYWQMEMISV